MMRAGTFLAALLLGSQFVAACYRYSPVRSTSVPVGTAVRAHLSETGLENLQFVPRRVQREVEGELVRLDNGTLLIEVPMPANPHLSVNQPFSQVVTLSPEDFVALDRKEPDRLRSSILVGGVAAVLGVIAYRILTSTISNNEEEEPVLQEIRIPILRW
ncbi:MAG: hypothetical protein ACREL7_03100 [Longimicrobiales bacterium]